VEFQLLFPHQTPEVRERRRRLLAARHTAELCALCDVPIPRGAPVWRPRLSSISLFGNESAVVTIVCEACAPPWLRYCDPRPCQWCGRSVTKEWTRHSYRIHVFCCDRCSWRWYDAQRNVRARESREAVCSICGHAFVPKRRGAQTCSPACRQKAYRLRQKQT
jgi:hypothetical protein